MQAHMSGTSPYLRILSLWGLGFDQVLVVEGAGAREGPAVITLEAVAEVVAEAKQEAPRWRCLLAVMRLRMLCCTSLLEREALGVPAGRL